MVFDDPLRDTHERASQGLDPAVAVGAESPPDVSWPAAPAVNTLALPVYRVRVLLCHCQRFPNVIG